MPVPILQKKPMCSRRAVQRAYNQSFFHPKKEALIGAPHSLVD